MNSLHLFAGIGGGILADKILGHTIVGAVEIEPYCRAVLKQRQDEGYLEPFPIFEDIRTFNGNEIRERIDLVCGGFPCQDISTAGQGAGISGKKSSLFYELIRVCRTIKPRYIFLENSPAITGRGLGVVLNEIASLGYDAEWTDLSAGICGAPHLRNRWWCLCKRQEDDFLPDAESCGHALYEREYRAEGRAFLSTPNVGAGQYDDSSYERELRPERIVEGIRRRFGDLCRGDVETVQRGSVKTRKEKRKSGPCRTSDDNGDGGRVAAQGEAARARNNSLSRSAGYFADSEGQRLFGSANRTAIKQNGTELTDAYSGCRVENAGSYQDEGETSKRDISDAYTMGREQGGGRSRESAETSYSWPFCRSNGYGADEGDSEGTLSDSTQSGAGQVSDANTMGRESCRNKGRESTEKGLSRAVGGYKRDGIGWWEIEPDVDRVAHGVPHRVDRLKGLGNAQVPVVAALAFYMLMERFCE